MNYKIVFFDVDGTITSHLDGTISEKTKEAIRNLLDKGIKVVAATGRPLSMCEPLRALGIDTFITANGAYTKHGKEIIHKLPLEQSAVQEVFEYAVTENHGLSFFTEKFYMNGVREPQMLEALKETLALADFPDVHESIYKEEVYLMCLYGTDETAEKFRLKFPHLSFVRWHPYVLNVLQQDVSKSVAIKQVLHHLRINPSEAIAFGDGENDIDMLQLVGLGIAMGNGSEKLKEIADFVTKPSSKDGIYFALKKFGII